MTRKPFTSIAPALFGLCLMSATASAQSISLPTLDFPDADTGWGCHFTGGCGNAPV